MLLPPTITSSNSRILDISPADPESITLRDLIIDGANGSGAGGAIRIEGAQTDVILERVTIRNASSTDSGGAISIVDGTLMVVDSSIANNTASAGGGGIRAHVAELAVIGSTLLGNTAATTTGGGIQQFSGATTLVNSTISGNVAADNGGGISIFNGSATLTSTNCTIADNTADSDADDAGDGGGISVLGQDPGTAQFQNTLIAGNFDLSPGAGSHSDVSGEFVSLGNNLVGITDGLFATGTPFDPALGDISGTAASPVAARIGSLADNGGLTQTHALLTGSPAINAGNNAAVTAPPFRSPFTDQSGKRRALPVGGSVDIGAFEYQPVGGAAPFVVRNTNDSGVDSLRNAVGEAIAAGGGSVVFDAGVFATAQVIHLTTGQIDLSGSVEISGPGRIPLVTITADSRIFEMASPSGGTVVLRNLDFENATGVGAGGAIRIDGENQELSLLGCEIRNSTSTDSGGAISVVDGKLVIEDTTIAGNTAAVGGGGIRAHVADLSVIRSTISGNVAQGTTGGGIQQFSGETTMVNSTISGNTAADNGGGISVFNGSASLTATNCTIADNTSDSDADDSGDGGGVSVLGQDPGTAKFQNTLIASNFDLSPAAGSHPDVSGEFVSLGNNLIGNRRRAPRDGDSVQHVVGGYHRNLGSSRGPGDRAAGGQRRAHANSCLAPLESGDRIWREHRRDQPAVRGAAFQRSGRIATDLSPDYRHR